MAVTDGRRDSGINTYEIEKGLKKPAVKIVAYILICALAIAFFAGLCIAVRQQERKMEELDAQRRELADKLDSLKRENELLESKLEYTKSLEGLLQYARENLGYVFPDDTRIDDGSGNGD